MAVRSAWEEGAKAEAAARDEGLCPVSREVRDTLEALARLQGETTGPELVGALARIYCPARLKRKYRSVR
jgi:hypothetical protein